MRLSFASLCVGASLMGFGFASPVEFSGKDKRSFVEEEGVKYTVFEHAATNSTLKFVTNSGICETTPGVNQYSGKCFELKPKICADYCRIPHGWNWNEHVVLVF
jgi:hypothetical protein